MRDKKGVKWAGGLVLTELALLRAAGAGGEERSDQREERARLHGGAARRGFAGTRRGADCRPWAPIDRGRQRACVRSPSVLPLLENISRKSPVTDGI